MHLIDKKKYCILINAITNNIYDSMEKEITMSILEDGNNNTIFNIIHDLHVVIHSYKKYEEELDKNAK
jgi:hypothetical protein